jgi:hypothetical protein
MIIMIQIFRLHHLFTTTIASSAGRRRSPTRIVPHAAGKIFVNLKESERKLHKNVSAKRQSNTKIPTKHPTAFYSVSYREGHNREFRPYLVKLVLHSSTTPINDDSPTPMNDDRYVSNGCVSQFIFFIPG